MAGWGKQPDFVNLPPRSKTDKQRETAIAEKIAGREHGMSYTKTGEGFGATNKAGVHSGFNYTGQKGGKPAAKKPAAKKPTAKKPAAKKPAAKKPAAKKPAAKKPAAKKTVKK